MRKKILKILPFIFGIACAVLLLGFFIPMRLEVEINPQKLESYDQLEREDLTVYLSPLFKRGREINDYHFEKKTENGYDDIAVQQTIFYKRVHIKNTSLDKLVATYEGSPHEGDKFEPSKIKVVAKYKDGKEETIKNFKIINQPKTLATNTDIMVRTSLGSTKLEIPFQKMSGIVANYKKLAYEGDSFDEENVSVSLEYEDGTMVPVENFKCEGKGVLRGKTDYTVYTSYGTTTLEIIPVQVANATAPETYTEGDTFDGNITLTYTDGETKTLKAEDVTFENTPELTYGINAIPFSWKSIDYTLYVAADYLTPVTEAERTLTDEIESSLYNEITKDLFLTVTKRGTDRPFYLSHIVLSDPKQIYAVSANGKFGTGLESPKKAAKRTKWTLGINGSFFDTLSGMPVHPDCIIRNGEIVSDGFTTGYEICLTKEGALFSPPEGVSAESLISAGVKDVLISTDPLLLQDGNVYSEGDTTNGGSFPRTAIGMVRPGEYYFLTTDEGLTYSELQSVFAELGCSYARSLDGGSSVSLMYKEQTVNSSSDRAVADFLCISSEKGGDSDE